MLQRTTEQLAAAGYRYIGMDHFALPDDELASAQEDGTLQRNFQGYTTHGHCDLVGLGVSAISQIGDLYSQNSSDINDYQTSLDNGQLAIRRGLHCNSDDRVRRAVIQQLICHFELAFEDIETEFGIDFRSYFAELWPDLERFCRRRPDPPGRQGHRHHVFRTSAGAFDLHAVRPLPAQPQPAALLPGDLKAHRPARTTGRCIPAPSTGCP